MSNTEIGVVTNILLKLKIARQVYGPHINYQTIQILCRTVAGRHSMYGKFSLGTLPPFIHIGPHPSTFDNPRKARRYGRNLWYVVLINPTKEQPNA